MKKMWTTALITILAYTSATQASPIWRAAYQMPEPSYEEDADADGTSDAQEELEGTNPYDPSSRMWLKVANHQRQTLLVQWDTRTERKYWLQGWDVRNQSWIDLRGPWIGSGQNQRVAIDKNDLIGIKFLRVAATLLTSVHPKMYELMSRRDADGDGISDWDEWTLGSSVIDENDLPCLDLITNVDALELRWNTERGWKYYLERSTGSGWERMEGPYQGTGQIMMQAVPIESGGRSQSFYRLTQESNDTDGDGLLDWEEVLVGSDPLNSRSLSPPIGDYEYVTSALRVGGKVELYPIQPTIHPELGGDGILRVIRENGLAPISVTLSIKVKTGQGNHLALQDLEVPFRAGEMEKGILVNGNTLERGERITFRLKESPSYTIGRFRTREIAKGTGDLLDVRNFGAVGDGRNDDTQAMQAALDALRDDPSARGLWFPKGRYRLTTFSGGSNKRWLLKFGSGSEWEDRDILLLGDEGSTLYSDVGGIRARIFQAEGEFRSLWMHGLRLEKSPAILPPTGNSEPNGADGFYLDRTGRTACEGFLFTNCEFVNTHRALTFVQTGYDLRGMGGCLILRNNKIFNPYGANTAGSSWGGGQQTYVPAWISHAIYENNLFEGASEDMRLSEAGNGHLKDGSHFGSPLFLEFRENIVKRMGVEAVFLNHDGTMMGVTLSSFVVPAADGKSTARVLMNDALSSYPQGFHVNIRTPLIPGQDESNLRLRIEKFDAATRTLTVSNPGAWDAAGDTIGPGKTVYLDEYLDSHKIVVENNWIDGDIPPGGVAGEGAAGIVIHGHSLIRGNIVTNYATGILNREEVHTPMYNPTKGSRIEQNLIVTRNAYDYPSVYTYGIHFWSGDATIFDNFIATPVSWKTNGITVRSADMNIYDNVVVADIPVDNGYMSVNRASGIAQGNPWGADMKAYGNSIRGFDLGIGNLRGWAGRRFFVFGNLSVNNSMAVELNGVVEHSTE